MADPAEKDVYRHKGRFVSSIKRKWLDNSVALGKRPGVKFAELDKSDVVVGRRIVEVNELASGLWCHACNAALSLKFVEGEVSHGLASNFFVRCHTCLALFSVPTGKRYVTEENKKLYAVNTKPALGMIDSGMGPSHVNTFLTAMNIPPVPSNIIKRHEREVGPKIEAVAKESCKGILVEKELTLKSQLSPHSDPSSPVSQADNSTSLPTTPLTSSTPIIAPTNIIASTPIIASFDGAWQKRGTGHAYDSLTGHGSLIGHNSGKVLAYATRKKGCALCARGRTQDDHDCRANHNKSAKSMEPEMAVEVTAHNSMLGAENVTIGTLIGDDDSSTISAVRRESMHEVEKLSDINHAKKALSNALYKLNIQPHIIKYLKYNFGTALEQNKNNAIGLESAIMTVISHAFDDHEKCGPWCTFKDDPYVYKHRGLPNGKGLKGDALKLSLERVFSRFASNAAKLAPCGSSQRNESFNSVVASKHPKSRYYGGSESLDFRVSAAVCQKNEGTKYVVRENECVGISPGEHTMKFRQCKDRVREHKAVTSKTRESKRRRLFLKHKRTSQRSTCKRKEGVTYATECGLDGVAELVDDPDPVVPVNHTATPVIFDLETSGFGKLAEICQIAAARGSKTFCTYIVPERGIPEKVTDVTGMSVRNGELCVHGERVQTTPPRLAIVLLFSFLVKLARV